MHSEGYVPQPRRDSQKEDARLRRMYEDLKQAYLDGDAADRLFKSCGYRGMQGET